MSKESNNYEISDSLWERVTQYASAVSEAWGKDVDSYVEEVMDTDRRSDDENVGSTVLQDSAHNVALVAHLVGSVFSNDFTKARAHEIGSALSQTQGYQNATETAKELESAMLQATEQFMDEHPQVRDAWKSTEENLKEVTQYVTQEAKTFTQNHPEITHDFQALSELASIVPAVKTAKVATGAQEFYTYTAKQAEKEIAKIDLKRLEPKEIEAELHRIVNHLDTTDPTARAGATTVLYSGTKLSKEILKSPEYRVLDNTEAFKFLQPKALNGNKPLKAALGKVHNTDKINFKDYNSPAGIFIGGDDGFSPRKMGAWDIISHQFAKGAQGNVVTKVGERAEPNRVLFHTELPTVQVTPSSTHIDAIPKQEVFKSLEGMPSEHHQLNHFKVIEHTRNKVAAIRNSKDPLALTPNEIQETLDRHTNVSKSVKEFKTKLETKANEKMHHSYPEHHENSPLMEQEKRDVTFSKTDAVLATVATVAIEQEKEPFDTTAYAEKIINNMAEARGWNNDNSNSYDGGRDIE